MGHLHVWFRINLALSYEQYFFSFLKHELA